MKTRICLRNFLQLLVLERLVATKNTVSIVSHDDYSSECRLPSTWHTFLFSSNLNWFAAAEALPRAYTSRKKNYMGKYVYRCHGCFRAISSDQPSYTEEMYYVQELCYCTGVRKKAGNINSQAPQKWNYFFCCGWLGIALCVCAILQPLASLLIKLLSAVAFYHALGTLFLH